VPILRSVWTFLKLLVGLGLAAGATMLGGVIAESVGAGDQAGVVALVAGLLGWWLFVIRPMRRGRSAGAARSVPASVVGIERLPPPGAPWFYWTFVTFDSRGVRVKLHLSKGQAKRLFKTLSVGDVGHLKYVGDRLVDWDPASAARPVASGGGSRGGSTGPSVFLSYAHEWADDARYLEEFFRSRGFDVWLDDQSLRFGDRLQEKVSAGIRKSTFFIPLLSTEYWTSEWCLDELETAASSGCRVIPLKVSDRELVMPPHVRKLYRESLGDPVHLDLRGRNPVPQLEELARQMRE
jgi:hypothetical protein